MKKIFKKNQIIITALAIMIAVAGYLNFSKDDALNVAGTDTTGDDTYLENTEDEDIGLLDLSEEDIQSAQALDGELEVSDTGEVMSDEVASEDGTQVGEAVLVSNTINGNFFSSARLTREQTRAKNKEMLLEIVDNTNVSEAQKEEAVSSIVKLTEIAEKESATEILLGAKGFDDVVVSIVDDSVDVIVNANELTEQQIAQIEDIVKRKTEIAAENIVISPVGVAKN